MLIKGFVGFWGNTQRNKMSQSLCDKYESVIYNGVSFFNERYTVFFSDEYLVEQDRDRIIFNSGKDSLSDIDELMVTIDISSNGLRIDRDRWGTRMTYYVLDEENIYFASDMRFLLELPLDNIKEYDQESILENATLGYIYNVERTLFSRIKQLPRNCRLESKDGVFTVSKKLISSEKSRFVSFEEACLAFEEVFEKSVSDTCKMNGNRAYFLSGGMDSSAIAIAASKTEQINTISFSSGNNSEDVYYAGKLAECINSKHTVLQFDDDKALMAFPFFLNAIENVEMAGIFSPLGGFAVEYSKLMSHSGFLYNFVYFLLVIFFTYFYSAITFNIADIADNMKKFGGFIPGIRPGKNTVEFLNKIMNRITFISSILLGLIAIAPNIIMVLTGIRSFYLGSTSLLIIVGVALDTMQQLEARSVMKHYQGFMKK